MLKIDDHYRHVLKCLISVNVINIINKFSKNVEKFQHLGINSNKSKLHSQRG
jgi:hypothetical protein